MIKKKRAANFTIEEKEELLDAVLRHKDVLFGKLTLYNDWPQKNAAWSNVLSAVNAVSFVERRLPDVRRKLKDLKAAVRKKFMEGGQWKEITNPKEITAEEQKVISLLRHDYDSVAGNLGTRDESAEDDNLLKIKEEIFSDEETAIQIGKHPSPPPPELDNFSESANVETIIMPPQLKRIKLVMHNGADVPLNGDAHNNLPPPGASIPEIAIWQPLQKDSESQTEEPASDSENTYLLRRLVDSQFLIAHSISAIEKVLTELSKR